MNLVESAKRKRLINLIVDLVVIFCLIELSLWLEVWLEHTLTFQAIRILILLGGYYIPMEYFFGKTIGKFITGTSVVNHNGSKISFETAFRRYITRWIPFEFASLAMGEDAKAWHDVLTKTFVIDDQLSKPRVDILDAKF